MKGEFSKSLEQNVCIYIFYLENLAEVDAPEFSSAFQFSLQNKLLSKEFSSNLN